MREERETGSGTRLQRIAHEMLIEVEQRRVVRCEERRADDVPPGCRLHPHRHLRTLITETRSTSIRCPGRRCPAATALTARQGPGRRRPVCAATAIGLRR